MFQMNGGSAPEGEMGDVVIISNDVVIHTPKSDAPINVVDELEELRKELADLQKQLGRQPTERKVVEDPDKSYDRAMKGL